MPHPAAISAEQIRTTVLSMLAETEMAPPVTRRPPMSASVSWFRCANCARLGAGELDTLTGGSESS